MIILFIEHILCAGPLSSSASLEPPCKLDVLEEVTANPEAQRCKDHLEVARGLPWRTIVGKLHLTDPRWPGSGCRGGAGSLPGKPAHTSPQSWCVTPGSQFIHLLQVMASAPRIFACDQPVRTGTSRASVFSGEGSWPPGPLLARAWMAARCQLHFFELP